MPRTGSRFNPVLNSGATPQTGGGVTLDTGGSSVPGNTGFIPNQGPPTDYPAGGGLPGGSDISAGQGGGQPGNFTGDSAAFLNSLYNSRPVFLQQQQDLLTSLGPSLRSAVFAASPELAQTADYYNKTFNDPFGGSLSTYQDVARQAQAARGFGGGGTGPSGEEARYLTNFAEQRRMQLAPQMAAFGQQILGNTGLAAPPDINLGTVGGLAIQNRQLTEQVKAGKAESAQAKTLYEQYLAIIKSNGASAAPPSGPNNPFGNAGRGPHVSVIVGEGAAGGVGSSSPFNPYNL